jgi:hypothetical protein
VDADETPDARATVVVMGVSASRVDVEDGSASAGFGRGRSAKIRVRDARREARDARVAGGR